MLSARIKLDNKCLPSPPQRNRTGEEAEQHASDGAVPTQLQARAEPAPQQLLSLQVPALAQAEQQTASFFGLTSCRVAAEDAKPRSYSLQKTHHTPPFKSP